MQCTLLDVLKLGELTGERPLKAFWNWHFFVLQRNTPSIKSYLTRFSYVRMYVCVYIIYTHSRYETRPVNWEQANPSFIMIGYPLKQLHLATYPCVGGKLLKQLNLRCRRTAFPPKSYTVPDLKLGMNIDAWLSSSMIFELCPKFIFKVESVMMYVCMSIHAHRHIHTLQIL